MRLQIVIDFALVAMEAASNLLTSSRPTPWAMRRKRFESGQNAIWSHRLWMNPRLLHGIGGGADWFPGDNYLLTTGRKLLIKVSVVRPARGGKDVAKRVAKATIASSAVPGRGSTLR